MPIWTLHHDLRHLAQREREVDALPDPRVQIERLAARLLKALQFRIELISDCLNKRMR
jgi:hypothetical protein